MVEKIETTDQLETHLSKYVAAYRKSYKICRSAHLSLQILAGRLGCGAVLTLVPAVPIFVAIAGALPAGISVVVSKAQLKEKESLYKGCHRTLKQLLREIPMNKMRPDVDERETIRETFSTILQLSINFNREMIISKKEQNDFKNAKSCHICNKEYNNEDVPVRDHCNRKV